MLFLPLRGPTRAVPAGAHVVEGRMGFRVLLVAFQKGALDVLSRQPLCIAVWLWCGAVSWLPRATRAMPSTSWCRHSQPAPARNLTLRAAPPTRKLCTRGACHAVWVEHLHKVPPAGRGSQVAKVRPGVPRGEADVVLRTGCWCQRGRTHVQAFSLPTTLRAAACYTGGWHSTAARLRVVILGGQAGVKLAVPQKVVDNRHQRVSARDGHCRGRGKRCSEPHPNWCSPPKSSVQPPTLS